MFRPHTFFRSGVHYGDSPNTYPSQSRFIGAAPAAAPKPVVRKQATLTGQAAGLINTAATPVRWAFKEAGGLANWVGNTLKTIGNKL